MWRPRLPALRNWLAPGTEKQTHRPGQWTLPPESDLGRYWTSNKLHSVADQPWYKDNNPYLGLPRKYLGITRRRLPGDKGGESQNPRPGRRATPIRRGAWSPGVRRPGIKVETHRKDWGFSSPRPRERLT
ncbi:hypothetical protein SMAC4_13539 [Sordaria macrospora]|uniref:uncharacterized protein n=1 Tax=Sordaria macrospora TaxID=5147 RepID=UPI002B28B897|nr:hypothetical protein SMAC4_13539 [Sordaria macrospora]